jgi:predicted amidohydrolase
LGHDVTRIGFFHFVADHTDPIRALQTALRECGDVEDSLIVLPEGFNNGKPYENGALHEYQRKREAQIDHCWTLQNLVRIAESAKVIFVAGILDGVNNSAYLVESGGPRLMCHKQADDETDNYDPCTVDYDKRNPIHLPAAGVWIITLICKDFADRPRLKKLSEKCGVGRKVVCIPASMSDAYFSGDIYTSYDHLLGKYVVLANSNPITSASCGSFIGNLNGRKVAQCTPADAEQRNRIHLRSWSELGEDQTA